MKWGRTATATFRASFITSEGQAVTLTAPPTVTILNPSLAVENSGLATYTGDGNYSYSWVVPENAALGMWQVTWVATSNDNVEMYGEEWFEVTPAGSIIIGSSQYDSNTVCGAWATETELIAHCTILQTVLAEIPDGVIGEALLAASDVLYTLSGRIFSGLCIRTVTPSYTPTAQRYCGPGLNRINLGVWPIHSVVGVEAGGEVVDPATYSLTGFKYLTFTGEIPAGITATVQYGMIPPLLGKRACLALACEMLAAYVGDENDLPGGVATSVSRQGISEDTINPEDLLENGRTGIYEVDRFLMVYNPRNIPSPSFVISPDHVASEHIPVEYPWPYGRY